jgi:hypothetical protein
VKQRLTFPYLDIVHQGTILESTARTVSMRRISLRQSVSAASEPWRFFVRVNSNLLTPAHRAEARLVREEVLAAAAELQRFAKVLEPIIQRDGFESTWADAKGPASN